MRIYTNKVVPQKSASKTEESSLRQVPPSCAKSNSKVAFYGLMPSPKFIAAKAYLDSAKLKLSGKLELKDFDLDKLEGIQEGIDVFKGVSMKQIAFLTDNFFSIIANRGCSNRCVHCYAAAVPQHFKPDSEYISKIDMEDFLGFTDGMKELKKGLVLTL